MLLVVNYHYLGMPDYPYPGIHSLSVEGFLKHLFWLKEHFELIGLFQLLSLQDEVLSKNTCLITFDDGLRCQFEAIFPLMEEYRFPAAFFISAKPLLEGVATDTHKFQYIRAHLAPDKIFQRIIETANEFNFSFEDYSEEEIKAHYRYDSFEVARNKYLLNYILPQDIRSKIVTSLFKYLVEDENSFCDDWYMDKDQIKTLHQRFSCIGSHAYSHCALASLSTDECSYELLSSKTAIEGIIGDKIYSLSYPLGNEKAVGLREAELAKAIGYRIGFTMERAVNFDLKQPLLLARLDANDIPVGKYPLFEMAGGEFLKVRG